MTARKNSQLYQKLEDIVGCKWSVAVLLAIESDIRRPGALEKAIKGISAKVLSERLRKLHAYNLIEKTVYAEIPPRTEYSLTSAGRKLVRIIGQIHELDDEMNEAPDPPAKKF